MHILFVLSKIFNTQKLSYHFKVSDKAVYMIDYAPFWKTLEEKGESWYSLTVKHGISSSTLHRLKHNKDISTKTINDLCRILNCDVQYVLRYIPSNKDQVL